MPVLATPTHQGPTLKTRLDVLIGVGRATSPGKKSRNGRTPFDPVVLPICEAIFPNALETKQVCLKLGRYKDAKKEKCLQLLQKNSFHRMRERRLVSVSLAHACMDIAVIVQVLRRPVLLLITCVEQALHVYTTTRIYSRVPQLQKSWRYSYKELQNERSAKAGAALGRAGELM